MGLAHFCEHMLFLGSKKYPNEDEYRNYIQSGGGSCNAYTSNHDTNYHFKISNEKFAGALNYMSECLTSPLFEESCVEREMNAVSSENDRYKGMDNWRQMLIMKSTAKKGHPFSKFGVGSLKTLGGEPGARDDLLKYHAEYYSANIMKLVLLSNHPIKDMEEWATKNFTSIPNKDYKPVIPKNPYEKE
jgi:insulysin